MSGKKHNFIISFLIFLIVLLIVTAIVLAIRLRSSHYEGASVATELALIDSYIQTGDTQGAVSSLKRLESRSLTANERIGVFKRYQLLGDDVKAEKCLKKALRKSSSNSQLIALYGNFLLRRARVDEALKMTKSLCNTEYASIYAEAFLRDALDSSLTADEYFSKRNAFLSFFKRTPKDKDETVNKKSFFLDHRFIPIYKYAFSGSKIQSWLINAAAILMADGNYEEASALYPGEAASYRDALFWGTVLYDDGKYADSLAALLKANSFDQSKEIVAAIELKALLSDDFYILGDDTSAQKMRQTVLDLSSPYMQAFMADKTPSLSRILPLFYMNTALYSRKNGDAIEQYDKLYQLVSYYPDYAPGLAAYAEYAIQSLQRPAEQGIDLQLRAAGLRTMKMEERDAVPVVSIADVVKRIDAALVNAAGPDKSSLLVLKEVLFSQEHVTDEKKDKASRVWALLEQNEISAGLYPAEIVRYATSTLLENGSTVDAETLFSGYIQAAYAESGSAAESVEELPHYFEAAEHPERLKLWECEFAAYFYLQKEDYSRATKMYKHILDTYSKRVPVFNTEGQNESVTASYLNLANLYDGYNRHAQALDYLNKANSRISDTELKAEVLYRIGWESACLGNAKDALTSLQYALKLNPAHNRARLLLKQLQI